MKKLCDRYIIGILRLRFTPAQNDIGGNVSEMWPKALGWSSMRTQMGVMISFLKGIRVSQNLIGGIHEEQVILSLSKDDGIVKAHPLTSSGCCTISRIVPAFFNVNWTKRYLSSVYLWKPTDQFRFSKPLPLR
jgi:hypothetical protein